MMYVSELYLITLTNVWYIFYGTGQGEDQQGRFLTLREIVQPGSDPGLVDRRKYIMQISDMVMHVDEKLGENSRRNVERTITAHKGVIHAHFNEKRPHLMLVSYDPKRTSSFDILAKMTKQHLGAERIG
jgi:hypothetical protein